MLMRTPNMIRFGLLAVTMTSFIAGTPVYAQGLDDIDPNAEAEGGSSDPLGDDVDSTPIPDEATTASPDPEGAKDPLEVPETMPTDPNDALPDAATDAMMTTPAESDESEDKPTRSSYFNDKNEDDDKDGGLFGAFRIGPTLSLGLPHPITYGLDMTYAKKFGGGVTFGSYKTEVDDVTIKMSNWDVRLRWFPTGSSFFTGLAYGNQTLSGDTSKNIDGDKVTVKLDVKTTYLTPHIGWFKTWDVGFTMGFELGYQIALDSKADLSTQFNGAPEDATKEKQGYKDLEKDAEDQGKKLGETNLPYITLMRLGWLL